MPRRFLELATTPAVLHAQEAAYGRARPIRSDHDHDPLGERERSFIERRDSFYMATVTEAGWPYVQHRGGPRGFLRVLDPSTLAFADYEGNRQLLSTGNVSANDRVALFLMDYPNRQRLKVLGHARVEPAAGSAGLVERLAPPAMRDAVERVFVVDVVAFDWNCPKYITPRFTVDELAALEGGM
jgi:hypothetical protein